MRGGKEGLTGERSVPAMRAARAWGQVQCWRHWRALCCGRPCRPAAGLHPATMATAHLHQHADDPLDAVADEVAAKLIRLLLHPRRHGVCVCVCVSVCKHVWVGGVSIGRQQGLRAKEGPTDCKGGRLQLLQYHHAPPRQYHNAPQGSTTMSPKAVPPPPKAARQQRQQHQHPMSRARPQPPP